MTDDTEPQTYTLDEAQVELNRRRCRQDGHDWEIQQTLTGPVTVVCACCGWRGNVTMMSRR